MNKALEALLANHKHHQDYDDHGGYAGSELGQQNLEAIATLQSAQHPFGQVTKHTITGQQFFYPWPQSPYLDNASECVTVYTIPQPVTEAAPEDHAIVPLVPTETQWGGLARDIMLAFDMNGNTPFKLMQVLTNLGREIPQWFRDELKDEAPLHVISKGTRVTLIYRAMVEAARQQKV